MVSRGMTLAERQELRERYRQRALADAERQAREAGVTLRCQGAIAMTGADQALIRAEHQACRGESPGGAGCLCTCHDNPGAAIEAS